MSTAEATGTTRTAPTDIPPARSDAYGWAVLTAEWELGAHPLTSNHATDHTMLADWATAKLAVWPKGTAEERAQCRGLKDFAAAHKRAAQVIRAPKGLKHWVKEAERSTHAGCRFNIHDSALALWKDRGQWMDTQCWVSKLPGEKTLDRVKPIVRDDAPDVVFNIGRMLTIDRMADTLNRSHPEKRDSQWLNPIPARVLVAEGRVTGEFWIGSDRVPTGVVRFDLHRLNFLRDRYAAMYAEAGKSITLRVGRRGGTMFVGVWDGNTWLAGMVADAD